MQIKYNKEDGYWNITFKDGVKEILFNFINEWSQLFCKCNWRTWDVIHFEIEDDVMFGGVSLEVILFGLGFRIRYNYKETEDTKEMHKRIEEVENGTAELRDYKSIGDILKDE